MKVAIIGTVGIPAKYGGFETLAEYLVRELNEKYEFTVYCSTAQYTSGRKDSYLGARLKYLPLNANGGSSIFYDMLSIVHALFYAETLLILGVSGAFMIPLVRFFTSKKVITNIDGLEWKRDKWNGFAKWYLKLQEGIAVRFSHHTVVDNEGIARHIRDNYDRKSTLIAYGADHVSNETISETTKKEFELPEKYAFKVCRIEPENNIHVILEAFRKSEINFVLVGNWENSAYGRNLIARYDKYKNLYLLNPIYNQKKLNELRSNCVFYIHGHSAGGTNPSLVEAMFLGLPIISYNVDYNRFTTDDRALYFKNSKELEVLLHKIEEDKVQMTEIAEDMRHLALQRYTWSSISRSYSDLFDT